MRSGAVVERRPIWRRPFAITPVATFDSPWAMDFLPGSGVPMTNMALVTEKAGKLWLVDVTAGRKQEVAGVPAVQVEGQGGLGEVVAHPDFAGNQRIYLSFAEAGPNGTSGAAIGYGRLILGPGPAAPRRFQGHLAAGAEGRAAARIHSERIAFAPDGTMFIPAASAFSSIRPRTRKWTLARSST